MGQELRLVAISIWCKRESVGRRMGEERARLSRCADEVLSCRTWCGVAGGDVLGERLKRHRRFTAVGVAFRGASGLFRCKVVSREARCGRN